MRLIVQGYEISRQMVAPYYVMLTIDSSVIVESDALGLEARFDIGSVYELLPER